MRAVRRGKSTKGRSPLEGCVIAGGALPEAKPRQSTTKDAVIDGRTLHACGWKRGGVGWYLMGPVQTRLCSAVNVGLEDICERGGKGLLQSGIREPSGIKVWQR